MTDTSVRPPESAPRPGEPRGEVAGEPWRVTLLAVGALAIGIFGGVGWAIMIFALLFMIFLHELGHYVTAKWSGMKVTEFFLFFGPKIWSFRRGETEYGIKLIPLGAYVRIIGMSNMDTEVAPEDEPRTYRQQSYPKRLLVVSAGSIMHVLQAVVLFFLAFSVLGISGGSDLGQRLGGEDPPAVIDEIAEGSGAAGAGIEPGDAITQLDGETVGSFEDLGPLLDGRAGDTVPVVVDRDGSQVELQVTLGSREESPDDGLLGVTRAGVEVPNVRVNPLTGANQALQMTGVGIRDTATNLVGFFANDLGDFGRSVADGTSAEGPTVGTGGSGGDTGGSRPPQEGDDKRLMSLPGIARIGAAITEEGLGEFLVFMALINLSLGVLNMLPLLPLDGGHVVIATYERLRSFGGRRHMADVSRLIPLTYAVLLFFLVISMSAIYLDIRDPIGLG